MLVEAVCAGFFMSVYIGEFGCKIMFVEKEIALSKK